MFIEVVGVPGSGKSSVVAGLEGHFKKADLDFTPLAPIARSIADKQSKKIRYLKRYKGHAWLYGAMSIAHESPNVFTALFEKHHHDLGELIWVMNFLAQYHFARQSDHSDKFIFIDEGFIYRGATCFFHEQPKENFQHYLEAIPTSDVIISIDVSAKTAIERCSLREKGIPNIYNADTDEEITANFIRIQRCLDYATLQQSKAGADVIHIDGSVPVSDSMDKLFASLKKLAKARKMNI